MCEIQNGDWNGGSGGRQDCGGNVNSFPSSQGYYEVHLKIKGSWRHRMTTTVRLMRKMKHELKTSLFRIGAVRLTSILRFKALWVLIQVSLCDAERCRLWWTAVAFLPSECASAGSSEGKFKGSFENQICSFFKKKSLQQWFLPSV